MADKPVLYDTSLRDGAQQEGISLTVEDRLKIADWLDTLRQIRIPEIGGRD